MDHVVPTSSLKGVCHEMRWFDLYFFHDSNPSRPLMNRLKCFGIRFWFPRDIQIFKKLCSVHPTAVSSSKVPRCASHRGVKWSKVFLKLCGVHLSVVCIPLRSWALRCASYHRVWLRSMHHTAESITYQLSVFLGSFTDAISLWCLKILIWNNTVSHESFLLQKIFDKMESKDVKYTNTKNMSAFWKNNIFEQVWLRGVHPTAESSSVVCISVHHTVESSDQNFSKSSTVCIPPRSQAPRCASHRRVKLHTMESKLKS